jgi:hypothetical protein
MLVGPQVIQAMAARFESSDGSLEDRLMAVLEAGQAAGGDKRGRVSAALLVKKMLPQDVKAAQQRIEQISRQKAEKIATLMRQAQAKNDAVPISVARFSLELKNALLPGTLIVDDSWSSSALIRQILDLKDTGDFQRARHGGAIGWGMPGAIGVKLAAWFPRLSFLEHADAVAALFVAAIVVVVGGRLGLRTVEALVDASPAGAADDLLGGQGHRTLR